VLRLPKKGDKQERTGASGRLRGGNLIPSANVENAIQQVTRAVASRAAGILIRNPAIDARFPDTSDLDFMVLADIDDLRSERLHLAAPDGTRIMTDLTWLPWAWVSDPEVAATRGWVPHRLLSSDLVWDSGGKVARLCQEIGRHMYRADIQQKRTGVFLDIGFQTVREIGITWDFPALALFWLHMAHAACLAAMLDGMRRLCPNVYTRPFDYLDEVERQAHPGLRRQWIEALHLDADPLQLIPSLRRIHAIIAAKFPEPDWPESIGAGTRFEYRYWLSSEELDWRIQVALEMMRRGDFAGAIFYLRFCAYAIARLPMVHAQAGEGRDVSFLRPEKAVLPELKGLVPEVIGDLDLMLAGTRGLDVDAVKSSLSMLGILRDSTVACLRARGTPVPELKAWEPYRPQAA
jgi:hypothetical protein